MSVKSSGAGCGLLGYTETACAEKNYKVVKGCGIVKEPKLLKKKEEIKILRLKRVRTERAGKRGHPAGGEDPSS